MQGYSPNMVSKVNDVSVSPSQKKSQKQHVLRKPIRKQTTQHYSALLRLSIY